MATSAETMTREAVGTAEVAGTAARPPLRLAFEPESFFLGRTEGAGVVRELPGKIVGIGPDRLEVEGHPRSSGAIVSPRSRSCSQ